MHGTHLRFAWFYLDPALIPEATIGLIKKDHTKPPPDPNSKIVTNHRIGVVLTQQKLPGWALKVDVGGKKETDRARRKRETKTAG